MRKSLVFILCSLILMACAHKQTQREQLIDRLNSLQQQGCMFGHQDDPFYGIGWEYEAGRSDVFESCGDWPAVMGFDLGGIEMGDAKNLDSVPFDCIREEIRAHHRRGGIVTISWHPRNPVTTVDHPNTWPEGSAWDATDGVVTAILAEGEVRDRFMIWLERVRTFLISLTDDNGQPIPIIFRPWHENNGAWFWWGNTHCTPDEYRALYTLTQDYLTAKRSNSECALTSNVIWSYSPNLDGAMTEDKFLQWYPGDDRIDLIGLDAYQWGTEEDFIRQTRADLDMLCAFGAQHHKPVALTECGFINVPDPTWWHRVLLPLLTAQRSNSDSGLTTNSAKRGLVYALVWRNAEKEHFGPVPDTESAEHFRAFYNSEHTLFLNDIVK